VEKGRRLTITFGNGLTNSRNLRRKTQTRKIVYGFYKKKTILQNLNKVLWSIENVFGLTTTFRLYPILKIGKTFYVKTNGKEILNPHLEGNKIL